MSYSKPIIYRSDNFEQWRQKCNMMSSNSGDISLLETIETDDLVVAINSIHNDGTGAISIGITQTGHGFVAGNAIRNNSGTWVKSQASSLSACEATWIVKRVIDANTFVACRMGRIDITGLGLTANTTYYVDSATAGELTATEPTTIGSVVMPCMRAWTTTLGEVFPSEGVLITSNGGSYSGGTTFNVNSAGLPGYAVRVDGVPAKADTTSNAEAVGIIQSKVGTLATVVTGGKVTLSGGYKWPEGAGISGDVLYISDTTNGELTLSRPTSNGHIIKSMVVCMTSNEGIVVNYIGQEIVDYDPLSLGDSASGDLEGTYPNPDLKINGQTEVTSPSGLDELILWSVANSDNRKVKIANLPLSTITGPSNYRLSLTQGDPIGTLTSNNQVFLVPYMGNSIKLKRNDGIWYTQYLTTSGISVSIASSSNDAVYDVFGYWTGSTVGLETAKWLNTSNRQTAIVIDSSGGLYCKATDRTRLYLGSYYCHRTGYTADSTSHRLLWNMYNRVEKNMIVTEPTATWEYNSSTRRSYNNNSNNKLVIMSGMPDSYQIKVQGASTVIGYQAQGADGSGQIGIGVNTNTNDSGSHIDPIDMAWAWGGDQPGWRISSKTAYHLAQRVLGLNSYHMIEQSQVGTDVYTDQVSYFGTVNGSVTVSAAANAVVNIKTICGIFSNVRC